MSAGLGFLLILSALLSAVTGAFTGVRAPEAQLHHAAAPLETARAAVPASVRPAAVVTVVAALPLLFTPRALPAPAAFALALPAPLETIRLLE